MTASFVKLTSKLTPVIACNPYSYVQHLELLALYIDGKRKGERTRDRILAVTARLLNERGFRGLKHNDICEAAGIGVATFYLYFQDKFDACRAVLKGFLEFIPAFNPQEMRPLHAAAHASKDPYISIFFSTLGMFRLARENTGLFRCFLETVGESDELMLLWREFSHNGYLRTARRMLRSGATGTTDALMFRTILAGGMVDELLRALVLAEDPKLVTLADTLFIDDAEAAEMMSICWYRIVLERDPDDEDVSAARVALRLGQ
jgi:AcrR family transcriptional regulator